MKRLLRYGLARFATVGVINTALSTALIFSLQRAGVRDLPANAAGYAVGLTCSFLLNKRWTFRHEGRWLATAGYFLLCFAFAYLANIATVLGLIDQGCNRYLAQLAGMPVYTIVFYLGCRLLAFRGTAAV